MTRGSLMSNVEIDFFGEEDADLIPWSDELDIDVTAIPELEMNHAVLPVVGEINFLGRALALLSACGGFVAIVYYCVE